MYLLPSFTLRQTLPVDHKGTSSSPPPIILPYLPPIPYLSTFPSSARTRFATGKSLPCVRRTEFVPNKDWAGVLEARGRSLLLCCGTLISLMRRSGLQSDVLKLYRQLLKVAIRKDDETGCLRKHGEYPLYNLLYSAPLRSISFYNACFVFFMFQSLPSVSTVQRASSESG